MAILKVRPITLSNLATTLVRLGRRQYLSIPAQAILSPTHFKIAAVHQGMSVRGYQFGDPLWVRESFARRSDVDPKRDPEKARQYLLYRADGSDLENAWHDYSPGWVAASKMPRWASRMHLEILESELGYLHDLHPDMMVGHGLSKLSKDGTIYKYGLADRDGMWGTDDIGWPWTDWSKDIKVAFARLWDQSVMDSRLPDKATCKYQDNPLILSLRLAPYYPPSGPAVAEST